MSYWGRILGIVWGITLGRNLYLMIIGFMIGIIIDKIINSKINNLYQRKQNKIFLDTTFKVMGHLYKSKGKITKTDIQMTNFVIKKMQLNEKYKHIAQKSFKKGTKNNFKLEECLFEFNNKCSDNLRLIHKFIEIQIQASIYDGYLHPNEKKILFIIAKELNLNTKQFEKTINRIKSQIKNNFNNFFYYQNIKKKQNFDIQKLCKILGVKENDNLHTIKKAYKKLMIKYHPDKLINKKLDFDTIHKYQKKAQKIQKAYQILKKITK